MADQLQHLSELAGMVFDKDMAALRAGKEQEDILTNEVNALRAKRSSAGICETGAWDRNPILAEKFRNWCDSSIIALNQELSRTRAHNEELLRLARRSFGRQHALSEVRLQINQTDK